MKAILVVTENKKQLLVYEHGIAYVEQESGKTVLHLVTGESFVIVSPKYEQWMNDVFLSV